MSAAEILIGAAAPAEEQALADPIIRLERVTKRYAGETIIDSLDLDIERGEFLTLLGPSGCGKTTTLKMIAGFEEPTEGRILVDGVDMAGVPPYRRPLNTVFQQYALFPHMTVFDNVAFGPRTAGRGKDDVKRSVEASLATVGMAGFAAKKPDQLSGGQQQRIALARALVNSPKALLLDEPLSALDVKLRRAMQLELKRIHTEVKTTFIFVTHDQDEALTMSSRIAVMNGGRIEQLDAPEIVYARPATKFVAGFIGQASLIPATISVRNGEQASLALPEGAVVRAAVPAGMLPGTRALLVLRPEQATLNREPGDRSQGFHAQLRTIDFQGPICRCALGRDDGQEIVVTVAPQHRPEGVEPGDRLWVAWDPTLAWVVADAESGKGSNL
jgi:spermidine/putrescine transport system ATP-binding protein